MQKNSQHIIQAQGDILKIPTLIDAYSKIKGDLVLNTDLRVDGKVIGKVETDKNIFIGKDGFVKGFLRANNLVSYGRIEGSIIVSGITILHPGSSIFGNLYTKLINVFEGAIVTAHVMSSENLEPIAEAQIRLAEEINSSDLNPITIPLYSNAKISTEEAVIYTDQESVHLHDEEKQWSSIKESSVFSVDNNNYTKLRKPVLSDKEPNYAFNKRKNDVAKPASELNGKSVLFESLLKHSLAENSDFLVDEIEKLNSIVSLNQPGKEINSNDHHGFGFNEVTNLLSRIKNSVVESAEKRV